MRAFNLPRNARRRLAARRSPPSGPIMPLRLTGGSPLGYRFIRGRVLSAIVCAADVGGGVDMTDALAYVCGHLDELRDLLGDEGNALLEQLQAAVQASADPGEVLDRLHTAVQAAGDVLGVRGHGERSGVVVAGVASVEIVYRCPLGRCAGRVRSEVREFPPHCPLSPGGAELVRERLT
jgi:hypothetical protein